MKSTKESTKGKKDKGKQWKFEHKLPSHPSHQIVKVGNRLASVTVYPSLNLIVTLQSGYCYIDCGAAHKEDWNLWGVNVQKIEGTRVVGMDMNIGTFAILDKMLEAMDVGEPAAITTISDTHQYGCENQFLMYKPRNFACGHVLVVWPHNNVNLGDSRPVVFKPNEWADVKNTIEQFKGIFPNAAV